MFASPCVATRDVQTTLLQLSIYAFDLGIRFEPRMFAFVTIVLSIATSVAAGITAHLQLECNGTVAQCHRREACRACCCVAMRFGMRCGLVFRAFWVGSFCEGKFLQMLESRLLILVVCASCVQVYQQFNRSFDHKAFVADFA